MTDEDRKLLRENNELLKDMNKRLDGISCVLMQIQYQTDTSGLKEFVINVIANALVGNR